jgi:hypothetical protein
VEIRGQFTSVALDGRFDRETSELSRVSINTLINRSKDVPDEEKQQPLKNAGERTTELLTLLERRGNCVMARLASKRIARIRQDAFGKGSDGKAARDPGILRRCFSGNMMR